MPQDVRKCVMHHVEHAKVVGGGWGFGGTRNQAKGGAPVGTLRVQQSIIVGKSVFTLLLNVHHERRARRPPAQKPETLYRNHQPRSQIVCHPRAPRAHQVKQNA